MFNKTLYNTPYHRVNLSKYSFLVTGGAGFIGANLVEYLLRFGAGHVRVLDNLSSGYFENIVDFLDLPNFEFIEGNILDLETCKLAVDGMDFISHQAAMPSVSRSSIHPTRSNPLNTDGFLNILMAAKDSPVLKQMVYAASSSPYGAAATGAQVEGNANAYGVTQVVNDLYADVFSRIFGLHTFGLRYFNIFGPKQGLDTPYAAEVPIFCKHFINGTTPIVNGDGHTIRDFTFVENAVQANIKMMLVGVEAERQKDEASETQLKQRQKHQVFNVACGDQISLEAMLVMMRHLSGANLKAVYIPERTWDMKPTKADTTTLERFCGYRPKYQFKEGLGLVYQWYLANSKALN